MDGVCHQSCVQTCTEVRLKLKCPELFSSGKCLSELMWEYSRKNSGKFRNTKCSCLCERVWLRQSPAAFVICERQSSRLNTAQVFIALLLHCQTHHAHAVFVSKLMWENLRHRLPCQNLVPTLPTMLAISITVHMPETEMRNRLQSFGKLTYFNKLNVIFFLFQLLS